MKSMKNILFATAMTATLAEAGLVDCQQKYCRSSNGSGGFDCWAGHGDPFACSGGRVMKLNGQTASHWFKTYRGYTCCVDEKPKPPPAVVPDVKLPKDCRFTKERKTPQICQDGQGRGKLITLPASTGKSWTLTQCAGQARAQMASYFVYSTKGSIGEMNCAMYEEQKPADQCQKWYSPNNFLLLKEFHDCANKTPADFTLGQAANPAECAALARGRNPYFTYGGSGKLCVAEPMKNDDCGYGWRASQWKVYKLAEVESYELYCDSDHRHVIKEITMGWRIKQSGPVKRDYRVQVTLDKTTTDTTKATQDITSRITDVTSVKVTNTVAIGMSISAGGFGATANNTKVNENTNDKTKMREKKIHKESIHAVTTALKQVSTTTTTFDCPDHPTKYKSIYQWVTEIDGVATVESANFACIYGGLEPRCIPKYCVDRQCQTCRTDDPDAAPAVALKDEGEIQALRKQVAELSTEVKMFTKGGDKQMCPVIKNLATKFCHLSL